MRRSLENSPESFIPHLFWDEVAGIFLVAASLLDIPVLAPNPASVIPADPAHGNRPQCSCSQIICGWMGKFPGGNSGIPAINYPKEQNPLREPLDDQCRPWNVGNQDKPAPEQSQPWTWEESLGYFQEEPKGDLTTWSLLLSCHIFLQEIGGKKRFVLCKLPWVCSELRKSRNPAVEMIPLRMLGDVPAWNNNGDSGKRREEGREKLKTGVRHEARSYGCVQTQPRKQRLRLPEIP